MVDFGYEPVVGFIPLPGTLQAPLGEISGVESPAEELAVDASLPVLDTIYGPNGQEHVVIPQLRPVGLVRRAIANDNAGIRPTITLAGPRPTDPNPIGAAAFDLYKEYPNRPKGQMSAYIKNRYIRFPFVYGAEGSALGYYNSNLTGVLAEGDFLSVDLYGRPVKYVPAKTLTAVGTVDSGNDVTVQFTDATNKHIPLWGVSVFNFTQVASVYASTGATPVTVATPVWNDDDGCWEVTITSSSAVLLTEDDKVLVTAQYGHLETKIFGQVGRILTGIDTTSLAGWLMRDMGNMFPYAPLVNPMICTDVAAEVVDLDALGTGYSLTGTTDADGNYVVIRLQTPYKYIDPTRTMKIEYSQGGTTYVTLNNLELDLQYGGRHIGPRFSVEFVAGAINLYLYPEDNGDGTFTSKAADLSTAKLRLTFSYEEEYPRGSMGFLGNNGTGIKGLTDGTYTGAVGNIKPAGFIHPDGAYSQNALGVTATGNNSGVMHILVR